MAETVLEHPEDTVRIRNIDFDCDEVETDVIPTFKGRQVSTPSGIKTIAVEVHREAPANSHREFFMFRHDRTKVVRIKPGETVDLPRYLANKLALKLAQHIIGKKALAIIKEARSKNQEPGRLPLITDSNALSALYKDIIVGVVRYHEANTISYDNLFAEEQEVMNKVEQSSGEIGLDFGNVNSGLVFDTSRDYKYGPIPEQPIGASSDLELEATEFNVQDRKLSKLSKSDKSTMVAH